MCDDPLEIKKKNNLNALVAKKILQDTEHVLIVEAGAQKLASESGMPSLTPEQLIVTSESQTSLHEEEKEEEDDGKNREQLKIEAI